MPKRKQRKIKVLDPVAVEKKEKLNQLLKEFRSQVADYEAKVKSDCERDCSQIDKMYQDKLREIPQHIQNMTIAQVMELQEKERKLAAESNKDEDIIRLIAERNMMSQKKKTQRREERKRSISASASSRHTKQPPPNSFQRISHAFSESNLLTPSAKSNRAPSLAVVPKFNPNLPLIGMARKPKPGEKLMSLSGSPLQNYVSDSKVSLNLGHGRILTFDEIENVVKNENMDDPTRELLQEVKKKLDHVFSMNK